MSAEERASFLPDPRVWDQSSGMMTLADQEFYRLFGDLLRFKPNMSDAQYFRSHGFSLVWRDGEVKKKIKAVAETAVALFDAAAAKQPKQVYGLQIAVNAEQVETWENIGLAHRAADNSEAGSIARQFQAWLEYYKVLYATGWQIMARVPAYCKDILSNHSDGRMAPETYAIEDSVSPDRKLNVGIILAGSRPLSVICNGVDRHVRNAQAHPQEGIRFLGRGASMKVRLKDRAWEQEYTLEELKAMTQELEIAHQGLEIAFVLCKVNHEREWRQHGVKGDMASERASWHMASYIAWVHGFELKAWQSEAAVLNVDLKRLPQALSVSGGPSTMYMEDNAGRAFKQTLHKEAFYWRTDDQALSFLRDMANSIASQRVELKVYARDDEFEGCVACDGEQLKQYANGELTRQEFIEGCGTYRFDRRPQDERLDKIVRRFMEDVKAGKIKPPS